jgi:DedD protein
MEEKNELNDIILNKNSSSANNKKIILAVATLGIILIIVVMLMNSLTSSKTDNLPQPALPPEPQKEIIAGANEPLFEEVSVVREAPQDGSSAGSNTSLDKIAQKLKEESIKESTQSKTPEHTQPPKPPVSEPKKLETPKNMVAKETPRESPRSTPLAPPSSASSVGGYYVQVGSFEKHQPDDKFLNSILNLGYKYKFHEVKTNARTVSKVLVGPFSSQEEARKALVKVRASVEAGAFLTKI